MGPSAQNLIEPFFFGPSDRQLLGCYHPPSTPIRECGLVLCYPLGHEYIKFHRAYRQLALLLADAGFPVLRFDFRGCGDSAGGPESWSVANWLEDLDLAIAELARRVSTPATGLVGMRLGGTLALKAGAARGNVDSLVLWDPVLNGRAYLQELAGQHREMLKYAHVLPDPAGVERKEILGHPMPDALAADLGELALLQTRRKPARKVLLIDSNDAVDQEPLAELLLRLVVSSEVRPFASPLLWAWTEDFGKVHVPHKILREIVGWYSEVYE